VQAAAFNCLLVVVAKTQQEEQFFDTFIFKEKSAAPDQQFWGNVIDCVTRYSFDASVVSPTFQTVYLGGYFNKELNEAATFVTKRFGYMGGTFSSSSLLSQQCLRSSSHLLGGSNLKRVFSQSQGVYSQSQSSSQLEGMSSSTGVSARRSLEDPRDPFSSLSQSPLMRDSDIALVPPDNRRDEYDIDAQQDSESGTVSGFDDCTIALEMNDINQQKCMGPLVRVVQRMSTLFHGRWEEMAERSSSVPYWITVCRDKLSDYSAIPIAVASHTTLLSAHDITAVYDQRQNVRLFMLRFLMNQPIAAIVSPFVGSTLLKPLLDCCLYDLCGIRNSVSTSRSRSEHPYHYTLRDFIFTMMDSWPNALASSSDDAFSSSDMTPLRYGSSTEAAAALLSYLFRYVFPSDESISMDAVKDNVKSVSALIGLWVRPPVGEAASSAELNMIRSGLDLGPIVELISTAESAPTGGAHAKASSRGESIS
jgi:hypothetical protein